MFESEKLGDGRVIFPGVDEAERRIDHAFSALARLETLAQSEVTAHDKLAPELLEYRDAAERAQAQAEAALDDDLNTPVALASLVELTRLGHELSDLATKRKRDIAFAGGAGVAARALLAAIERIGSLLGLLLVTPAAYAERTRERRLRLRKLDPAEIDAKIAERTAARKTKDFARSDEIRAELTAQGLELQDGPTGTTWSVVQ
jgi:cysteinyl-tRNA synthetase